ncbi:hypothetical protein EJB05_56312, partial [Eragrostis curvula]
MAAVGKAVQLWNEWELHVLVLLSFMLQVFLFFTGSLRQRSSSSFLRICIWAAYLGADAVPIYTLGFLSRQDAPTEGGASGGIPPLAIIWVPFLLVHLGGPDNITAFAIADNNLWVRHFLSLGLQVTLALYVVIWKSAGWSDRGLLVSCILLFVAGIIKYGERTMALKNGNLQSQKGITDIDEYMGKEDKDSRVVFHALMSMPGRKITLLFKESDFRLFVPPSNDEYSQDQSIMKTLEIELAMVYDDLYTKATIHCRRFGWLASVSMRLLSSRFGLSKKRILWSNSMGQYDLASALGCDNGWSSSWKVGVMRMIIRMVHFSGVGKGTILWFSKLPGIKYVEVDKLIIECLSNEVGSSDKEWSFRNLGPLVKKFKELILANFGFAIMMLHVFTELHLRQYLLDMDENPVEAINDIGEVRRLAEVCRKLSRFMLYIKMTYKEIFPTDAAMETIISNLLDSAYEKDKDFMSFIEELGVKDWATEPEVCVETLKELQRMWIRIIMYAAGKSEPEMHAAQLARGGELLTFVWLLMLHHKLGDLDRRVELFTPEFVAGEVNVYYAFNPPVSPA